MLLKKIFYRNRSKTQQQEFEKTGLSSFRNLMDLDDGWRRDIVNNAYCRILGYFSQNKQ